MRWLNRSSLYRTFTGLIACLLLGSLLHAQDTWTWVNPTPQGSDLNDIHIFDENTPVAVGNAGTVIKTTDGGNSLAVALTAAVWCSCSGENCYSELL